MNAGATAYVLKPANIDHIKNMLNQAIERQRLLEARFRLIVGVTQEQKLTVNAVDLRQPKAFGTRLRKTLPPKPGA